MVLNPPFHFVVPRNRAAVDVGFCGLHGFGMFTVWPVRTWSGSFTLAANPYAIIPLTRL
jgi:hypothetical protein